MGNCENKDCAMCGACEHAQLVGAGKLLCRMQNTICPSDYVCSNPAELYKQREKTKIKNMTEEERRKYNLAAFTPNYFVPIPVIKSLLDRGLGFFAFKCGNCAEVTNIGLKIPTARKFWVCMCGHRNKLSNGVNWDAAAAKPKYGPPAKLLMNMKKASIRG